ncbi:MAG: GntR family transcriptional regulator [Lachnospiraceae bacterium]|jgi:GntR family transcriptional regulator
MFIEIDFSSDEAIYQQLCNQIIWGIATSQYSEGQVLPSVRELADEVGINMHTVNKAYSVLKEEGFVKVDRRKGAVISVDSNKEKALTMIRKNMKPILAESYCRGIPREDIHRLVDEIYDSYGAQPAPEKKKDAGTKE